MAVLEYVAHLPPVRFLRWWRGELTDLVGGRGPAALILDVRPGTDGPQIVAPPGGADPAVLARGARRVAVRLDPHLVLRKEVELPLAAEPNLREVLGYEMARETPFRAEAVYYDCRVSRRDPLRKRLCVDLLVVPRATLDALLATLRAAGVEPDAVGATGADPARPVELNVLPPGRRGRRRLTPRLLHRVLLAGALVLLAAVVIGPLVQKVRAIERLEPAVAQARAEALAVRALEEEIATLTAGSQFVVEKKTGALRILDLLLEVTRLLPDETWLREFEVKQGVLQVRGETPATAPLLGVVEASERFANVRLPSPVTQAAGSEQERFHLAADVTPGGAP